MPTKCKLRRSAKHFRALSKLRPGLRRAYLAKCPKYVLDDIAESILNILKGNVRNISKDRKYRLRRQAKKLVQVVNARDKLSRRRVVYKQSGSGVFSILLPVLASIVGGLVSSNA